MLINNNYYYFQNNHHYKKVYKLPERYFNSYFPKTGTERETMFSANIERKILTL